MMELNKKFDWSRSPQKHTLQNDHEKVSGKCFHSLKKCGHAYSVTVRFKRRRMKQKVRTDAFTAQVAKIRTGSFRL